MLAGIAATAVVIVGVSSLFAYRAIFGVDEVGSPARIISAEAGPTKMVPDSEAKAGDGKLIQDRVGGAPSRGRTHRPQGRKPDRPEQNSAKRFGRPDSGRHRDGCTAVFGGAIPVSSGSNRGARERLD
jgi:hypothetical protein